MAKTPAKRKRKNSKISTTPPVPFSKRVPDLSNLQKARNEMAELIKAFHKRKISENRARTLAYLYQTFLAYLKAESEIEWQKKLTKVEEYIAKIMEVDS